MAAGRRCALFSLRLLSTRFSLFLAFSWWAEVTHARRAPATPPSRPLSSPTGRLEPFHLRSPARRVCASAVRYHARWAVRASVATDLGARATQLTGPFLLRRVGRKRRGRKRGSLTRQRGARTGKAGSSPSSSFAMSLAALRRLEVRLSSGRVLSNSAIFLFGGFSR